MTYPNDTIPQLVKELEGYDQVEWVRRQRYQERGWIDLVQLWQAYNHHIAHLMEHSDVEARTRPRVRHNLDLLAWQAVDAGQPRPF